MGFPNDSKNGETANKICKKLQGKYRFVFNFGKCKKPMTDLISSPLNVQCDIEDVIMWHPSTSNFKSFDL